MPLVVNCVRSVVVVDDGAWGVVAAVSSSSAAMGRECRPLPHDRDGDCSEHSEHDPSHVLSPSTRPRSRIGVYVHY